MPRGYIYNTMPPGVKYTPAGPGNVYADPFNDVTLEPGRYSSVPQINYAPMSANEYMRRKYHNENTPFPRGMAPGNINPLQMGIHLGIMGAVGGLGVAGVTEALRRIRGDGGEPIGGPGVLKHILIGGLIGTALGTMAGYNARNRMAHPQSWDDMRTILQRNTGNFSLPPEAAQPKSQVPAVKTGAYKKAGALIPALLMLLGGYGLYRGARAASGNLYDAYNNFVQHNLPAAGANTAAGAGNIASGALSALLLSPTATLPKLLGSSIGMNLPVAIDPVAQAAATRYTMPKWWTVHDYDKYGIQPDTITKAEIDFQNKLRSKIEGLPSWMPPSKPYVPKDVGRMIQ